MATRGLVDASIGAFWAAAGAPRPTTPQDLLRRQGRQRARRAAGTSVPLSARRPAGALGGAATEGEAPPELRRVAVELSGREGYNAAAVNGVWRFWAVRGGRLAFHREVELQAEDDEDTAEDAEEGIASPSSRAARAEGSVAAGEKAAVRLHLFYLPQVDSWLISDTPDTSGSVVADCGPVAGGEDLGQHWRVWDGEAWREDRNILAEVALGGPPPPSLQGLRVVPVAPTRPRAHSLETRPPPPPVPRAPPTGRPPDSARHLRTPRP